MDQPAGPHRAKPPSSPCVSFTPGYQACGAVPTPLIKYPEAALVVQLGCSLSLHYWHVFNNSLACAAEDAPPSICRFNSPRHNCVHFGKMNLEFAFALHFSNHPKCQAGNVAQSCLPPIPSGSGFRQIKAPSAPRKDLFGEVKHVTGRSFSVCSRSGLLLMTSGGGRLISAEPPPGRADRV